MNNWISKLAEQALRICRVNKRALGNTRQDMSGPVLTELESQGYTLVTWDSGHSTHSVCLNLDKQVWDLNEFLQKTTYDAPIFCRSHPGDISCTLVVSGPNLPNVRVDSFGNYEQI